MSTHTPGPWQMKRAKGFSAKYYTISRLVGRKRIHLEYATDGRPMLWGEGQARAAIAKARGAA